MEARKHHSPHGSFRRILEQIVAGYPRNNLLDCETFSHKPRRYPHFIEKELFSRNHRSVRT